MDAQNILLLKIYRFLKLLRCAPVIILLSFYSSLSYPGNHNLVNLPQVHQFIDKMVKEYNFSRKDLINVMNQAQFQPEIITKIKAPYEKKTWDVYKSIFFTNQRVEKGLSFWEANQEILAKAEKKYNVPANIIVAILGIETFYGQRQGSYKVLDALVTLAFGYPKRASFFKKELVEFLLLCQEHNVSPTEYMGSYAGAIGKPQFMPSTYRYYATNFTGSKKKDLINDNEAVIASIANYFHKHGWQMYQGVAQPAKVDKNFDANKISINTRQPQYKMQQLEKFGIQPITAALNSPARVGLIALTTNDGQEFWLAYPNFYVIERYNNSPQYAMAVFLLAQQLQREHLATSNIPKKHAYA